MSYKKETKTAADRVIYRQTNASIWVHVYSYTTNGSFPTQVSTNRGSPKEISLPHVMKISLSYYNRLHQQCASGSFFTFKLQGM